MQIFAEVTTSLGDKNINEEWGSQYDTARVALLLLLFYDAVLKLLLLMQGLVKIVWKVTVMLSNDNIDKERGGK